MNYTECPLVVAPLHRHDKREKKLHDTHVIVSDDLKSVTSDSIQLLRVPLQLLLNLSSAVQCTFLKKKKHHETIKNTKI